jgi:hypothetical protein
MRRIVSTNGVRSHFVWFRRPIYGKSSPTASAVGVPVTTLAVNDFIRILRAFASRRLDVSTPLTFGYLA